MFETFVVNEVRKSYENAGDKTKFFYYRDYSQNEVDLVFIKSGVMHCFECKFGKEHSLSDVSAFKELDDTEYEKGKGAIICTADEISALSDKVLIIPAKSL